MTEQEYTQALDEVHKLLFDENGERKLTDEESVRCDKLCDAIEEYEKEAASFLNDMINKGKCIACNGSGYYDHDGSPPCGACNGTGVEP